VETSGTILLGTEWNSGSWLEVLFIGAGGCGDGDKKYNSCLLLINTLFYAFDIYKLII
jgi:hypothetical protein